MKSYNILQIVNLGQDINKKWIRLNIKTKTNIK